MKKFGYSKKKTEEVLRKRTVYKVLQCLAENRKCLVIFLPPYSPDLNPIEKKWANTKSFLKNNIYKFETLQDAIRLPLRWLFRKEKKN